MFFFVSKSHDSTAKTYEIIIDTNRPMYRKLCKNNVEIESSLELFYFVISNIKIVVSRTYKVTYEFVVCSKIIVIYNDSL
jgi:hypothetical protein